MTEKAERFKWAVAGFELAVARFEAVAYDEGASAQETYIPLCESLNWCDSIADRVRKWERPELMRAIEYVRNAVHHQWLDALDYRPSYGEGKYGEGTYGGGAWKWKPVGEIPHRGPDDRRPLYGNLLEGKSALDTLRSFKTEIVDKIDGSR